MLQFAPALGSAQSRISTSAIDCAWDIGTIRFFSLSSLTGAIPLLADKVSSLSSRIEFAHDLIVLEGIECTAAI